MASYYYARIKFRLSNFPLDLLYTLLDIPNIWVPQFMFGLPFRFSREFFSGENYRHFTYYCALYLVYAVLF